MENTQKVPIVVPKVDYLGTFGTTIELFANETYLACVILTVHDAPSFAKNANLLLYCIEGVISRI